ncbi:hypothetical protein L1987_54444 [Smallanthus sonchifolius]|uniref:Uncharacterized protein n=1 Tax=Smallanthus sonchifolius TaxID=185202 RepID=A0ACB9E778_9ASTR|nr:hypothetical protein L1987_54444 [Smallanthus sonchifolius]
MSKNDLSIQTSKMTQSVVDEFCQQWGLNAKFRSTAPIMGKTVDQCPEGMLAMYSRHFELSNLRYPFSLFFLRFLQYYRLNFSQLSHVGVSKVIFFEVVCRSLGYEPDLTMFHRFFRLTKNGDWKPSDPLNLAESEISSLDPVFYSKHKSFSSPLRVYPEQLLVKLGLSVLWDPTFVPLLTLDGKDMSALDFLMLEDASDVEEDRRELDKGETTALVLKKSVCYQGGAYTGVPDVVSTKQGKGKKLASSSKVKKSKAPLRSSKRHASSGARASATPPSGPIDVSDNDDDFLAGCTGSIPSSVKLEPLDGESYSGGSGGSGGKKPELVPEEAGSVYVPKWSIKNGDSVKSHFVCQEMIYHFVTPADRDALRGDTEQTLIGRILVNAARILTSFPEGIDRLCDNSKKSERAEQKNCSLKEQLANAQSHVSALSAREKQLIQDLDIARKQYDVDSEKLASLRQNLEEQKAKMDAERVAVDAEWSAVQAEKESLDFVIEEWKSRTEVLAEEKRWLIEHGFQQVVAYLLHSNEFNVPLSDVYNKLLKRGRHMGLVSGYKNQPLKPISECSNYHPEAEQESIEAIQQMEQLTYPYILELSKYFDRPLSELQALEPQGLKKEAAEFVLKSLGSKRSRDEASGSKFLASVSLGGNARRNNKSRSDSVSETKTQASVGLQAADTPDKVVVASAEESVGTGPKPDAVETEKADEPSA